MAGNPIVYIDLNPWAEQIAMNLQLLQDRVRTETWVRFLLLRIVLTFRIYPVPKAIIIQSSDRFVVHTSKLFHKGDGRYRSRLAKETGSSIVAGIVLWLLRRKVRTKAERTCRIDAEVHFPLVLLAEIRAAEQKKSGECLKFCGNGGEYWSSRILNHIPQLRRSHIIAF